MKFFSCLWLFISFSYPAAYASEPPTPDWTYVEKKLHRAGLEKNFINALKNSYEEKNFLFVIKWNLLLFLKKTNYHAIQITDEAVENVQKFINQNEETLEQTEHDYGVGKRVIASLLWMETRHGLNYGNFHVPSVFIHLLQVDRKPVVKYLKQSGNEFSTKKITARQKKKIATRTKSKVRWALGELKSLQYMYKKNPEILRSLNGSFAGAFGMPQFLPTSYKHWARTPNKKQAPNLFSAKDAIYSVGYYLKDNGWKQKKSKTHVKALMRYNNSRDYAEAILEIADRAKQPSIKRLPTTAHFVDIQ